MNISIREHIINNFTGDNQEALKKAIEESIQENDEITLPGMGVFFQIVWEDADEELKQKILVILEKRVQKKESDSN